MGRAKRNVTLVLLMAMASGAGAAGAAHAQTQLPGIVVTTPSPVKPTPATAPPAPRSVGKPQLVQLQSKAFKCPYCGSTDTRLENIFGPTPCRSARYCETCRQPFEQFKTI